MTTDNNGPAPITVALADDHQLLREGLALLVSSFANCQMLYTAANGKELIAKIQQLGPPQVLLLDMSMPEMDGHQTALWLQQHHPGVKILMLTMHNTDVALVRLLLAGAKGFLKKDISPSELQLAIQEVVTTGYYCGPQTVGQMVHLLNNAGPTGQLPVNLVFSEREELFLQYCCTEMSYKEMAKLLSISPHTINNIRDSLFTRLQVNSRVGLAIYALKNGIAPL
jgi:two-component system, NarL family, invasion response regulator UvrY